MEKPNDLVKESFEKYLKPEVDGTIETNRLLLFSLCFLIRVYCLY